MQTFIKVICPECGEIVLTAEAITLTVFYRDTMFSQYAFTCTQCGGMQCPSASDDTVALLISACVKVSVQKVPDEAVEAKSGAAICYDDLRAISPLLSVAQDLGDADLDTPESDLDSPFMQALGCLLATDTDTKEH